MELDEEFFTPLVRQPIESMQSVSMIIIERASHHNVGEKTCMTELSICCRCHHLGG